jgi:hypothetical protein
LIVAGAVFGLVGGMAHLVMMLNREEQRQRTGK